MTSVSPEINGRFAMINAAKRPNIHNIVLDKHSEQPFFTTFIFHPSKRTRTTK